MTTIITKPTLFLNKDISLKNIQMMQEKALKNHCIFRPHFKTHQSTEIGNWFKELGIEQCTVSSIGMAEYFAEAGWKDITVAFPLNILEFDRVSSLSKSIALNICIESTEVASFLIENTKFPLGIFIKIDAGYHRTGVNAASFQYIEEILNVLKANDFCDFKGFLQHAGHSYHVKDKSEILTIHHETIKSLVDLKRYFILEYPNLVISCGDTPTCSIAEDFQSIDEMRPGNFAFYDVMQANIGACHFSQIAVAMACPVVAKHSDRNEIIIYGGAIHFSKDFITNVEGDKIFGLVCKSKDDWSILYQDAYIKKLSQEHGTIHSTPEMLEHIQVGDLLYCLPIHSCLTANLMNSYLTTKNQEISMYRYS